MTRDCRSAALIYAKRGWRVFPLQGKEPRTPNGFHDATTDRKQIRKWWSQWPDANVGIACDSSRGPVVLDIDGASGSTFINTLGIRETRTATTGKKFKCHLYFDAPLKSVNVARLIRPFKDDEGQKVELDILGDGGYVVAPPSIHPDTGRRYQWIRRVTPRAFPVEILEALDEQRATKKRAAPPLPNIIGEGERDMLLTSLAGTMRRRGSSPEAILEALRVENEQRVRPKLSDKQLRKIAHSIGQKEPAVLDEHLTDLGNARRFITQHAEDLRAVLSNRRPWLLWDGQRFTPDVTGHVERLAKLTVRRLYAEASRMVDEDQRDALLKHAAKSEQAPRISALIQLAATEPELSTTADMLDADPWLFNVKNGTLNLKTGALQPHERADLLTKLAPVAYNASARAPRWEQFLVEIMDGDAELVEFLQRAIGYAMTGDTREQCLFFLYGQGANGKSTFLEIIRTLFGEYAQQSDFSTFLASRGEGPRNDLARMRGARLVTASEADSEKGFDARIVKLLTGDDTIVARRLYEEHFEFRPQHKLFLAANHKPIVKEQTEGFWRRIRLIPFTVTFSKHARDKRLATKLHRELPGILNWALEGAQRWRADGLLEPAAIRKATRSYREENDVLGEFLAQRCVIDADAWTATPALYREFADWWSDTRGSRAAPISAGWFGRMLGERPEFKPAKRHHIRGWRGLSIIHEATQ